MEKSNFELLLTQDVLKIAENITPVLEHFSKHLPSYKSIVDHVQAHGTFPPSQKIKDLTLAQNILEHFSQIVGNTRQDVQEIEGVQVIYKYESENPSGSHYDRAYPAILAPLLERIVKSDKTLLELSSGSAGISIALISWLLGINLELYMPDSPFKLRPAIPRALGAKVYLTPIEEGVEGASKAINRIITNRSKYRGKLFLNHSQKETSLSPVGKLVDEIQERIDHAILVHGNGTFMRAVGEALPIKTKVWGTRYKDNPSKALQMPGNDEVNIDFLHHDAYQPNEKITISMKAVEDWQQDPKRKRDYGLTSSLVRVVGEKLIKEGKIKPGETVLIPDYEPGHRCETF